MEELAQETANLLATSAGLLVLLLGAVAGLIVGLLFAAFGWKRKDDAVSNTRVEAVQTELKDYKNDVNQHFAKTATLVNQLTNDYRAVYDHLANSSAKLCDANETSVGFDEKLQLAQQDSTEQPGIDEASSAEPMPEAESQLDAKPETGSDVEPDPAEITDGTHNAPEEAQPEAAVAASIPAKIPASDKSAASNTEKPS